MAYIRELLSLETRPRRSASSRPGLEAKSFSTEEVCLLRELRADESRMCAEPTSAITGTATQTDGTAATGDMVTTDIDTTTAATDDMVTTDIATTTAATGDMVTTDIATTTAATGDMVTTDIATTTAATDDKVTLSVGSSEVPVRVPSLLSLTLSVLSILVVTA